MINHKNLKDDLQQAYNQHANERNQLTKQNWKLEERNHFLSLLKKEQKQSLLEIGAGTGEDSLFFKENGFLTISTDLSNENIRICREKGLEAYQMDFYNLDFPSEHFDAVWALNCLLHVPKQDLDHVLQGIRRVLKPDGLFYLGVYGGDNFEGFLENDHYRPKRFFSFYTDIVIKEKVSQWFEVIYFKAVDLGTDQYHFQSMILLSKKHYR